MYNYQSRPVRRNPSWLAVVGNPSRFRRRRFIGSPYRPRPSVYSSDADRPPRFRTRTRTARANPPLTTRRRTSAKRRSAPRNALGQFRSRAKAKRTRRNATRRITRKTAIKRAANRRTNPMAKRRRRYVSRRRARKNPRPIRKTMVMAGLPTLPSTKAAKRSAAGRKAAKTRAEKKAARSRAAKKGARTRLGRKGGRRAAPKKRKGAPRKRRLYVRTRTGKLRPVGAVRRALRGKGRLKRRRLYRKSGRGTATSVGSMRLNPKRRRRSRGRRLAPRRIYRRRHVRRNPGFSPRGVVNVFKNVIGPAAIAFFGAAVASNLVGRGVGMVSARLPFLAPITPHMPVITASVTVLAANYAADKNWLGLRKWKTPLLFGTGILLVKRVYDQYVAARLAAVSPQVASMLSDVGQIPAYWQSGHTYAGRALQEYVDVPPGVGLSQLAQVYEAAAGLREYVGAAPGMQGYIEVPPGAGMFQEAAAGLHQALAGTVGAAYEGARIQGGAIGPMPLPHTMTPGEAAFESQEAGGDGMFLDGGIFG